MVFERPAVVDSMVVPPAAVQEGEITVPQGSQTDGGSVQFARLLTECYDRLRM